MSFVLGLTGGIACGKSTVAVIFKRFGAVIIDADLTARQIVEPQTKGWLQIKQQFGPQYFLPNSQLDRKRLGNLVFADQKQLAKLTAITKPLIKDRLKQQLKQQRQKQTALIVLMIPLLFEGNYQSWCDQVMTVSVTKAEQLARLQQRDHLTRQAASERIAAQMDQAKRERLADVIIDNSQSFAHLQVQVIKWLQEKSFNLKQNKG